LQANWRRAELVSHRIVTAGLTPVWNPSYRIRLQSPFPQRNVLLVPKDERDHAYALVGEQVHTEQFWTTDTLDGVAQVVHVSLEPVRNTSADYNLYACRPDWQAYPWLQDSRRHVSIHCEFTGMRPATLKELLWTPAR
jgi:hypothetical protein